MRAEGASLQVLLLLLLMLLPVIGVAQVPSAHSCMSTADLAAMFASAERDEPSAARARAETAARDFRKRFAPLHATIFSEGTSFSASKMLGDLWKLYPLAIAQGSCSADMTRLLAAVATVELKRHETKAGLAFGEAAARMDAEAHALPPKDLLDLHYTLADSAGAGRENAEKALRHMQEVQRIAPQVASLDPLQRFGIRESVGYWLHEAGRPGDARSSNEALLADAEKTLGAEHEALLSVLENLAQNSYDLKDLAASRAYLERCHALARTHRRIEAESRMLFQLGVLSFESGDDAAARRFMQRRVERVAQDGGHSDLRAEAAASVAELEERIRSRP
jgi:tetratricopeptide (TPR) repeat protein